MGHPLEDDAAEDTGFDEEDDLDLPPLGDTGAAEPDADEAGLLEIDDAAELEVGERESVGLDDEQVGETFDVSDLIDAAEQEGGFTENTDEAGDLAGDALEGYGSEGEYGWTEGTEAPSLDEWEGEVEGIGGEGEEESVLGDDTGEEGIDDPFVGAGGDEDSFPGLPPLDASLDEGPDEEASDLDLQDDAEIDVPERSFEQEARLMGERVPALLPDAQRHTMHFGPRDEAVYALALHAPAQVLLGGGSSLWRVDRGSDTDPRAHDLQPEGLEGEDVTSVAIDPAGPERMDAARVAVGTRLGGVFRSDDGGRSFGPAGGWRRESRVSEGAAGGTGREGAAGGTGREGAAGGTGREGVGGADPTDVAEVACFVAAEGDAEGTRLWARTRAGALYRSEDFGERWTGPVLTAPVAAMAVDPRGGLVALAVPRNGPALLSRTEDGGRSWRQIEAPPLGRGRGPAAEASFVLAAHGSTLAVSRDDDEAVHVTVDGGASWHRLEELPHAGALAIVRHPRGPTGESGDGPDTASSSRRSSAGRDDAPSTTLYAALYFEGSDRGVIVRQPLSELGSGEAAPDACVLDVRAERERHALPSRGDSEGDNRVLALEARARDGGTDLLAATGAGLFRVHVRSGAG